MVNSPHAADHNEGEDFLEWLTKYKDQEAVIMWPIWTGLKVASGHPSEAHSKGHIQMVAQGHSKGGKVWT